MRGTRAWQAGWCWSPPWAPCRRKPSASGPGPSAESNTWVFSSPEPDGGAGGRFTSCADMSVPGAFDTLRAKPVAGEGVFPEEVSGRSCRAMGLAAWNLVLAPAHTRPRSRPRSQAARVQGCAHPGFTCENSLLWQKQPSASARVSAPTCLQDAWAGHAAGGEPSDFRAEPEGFIYLLYNSVHLVLPEA